MIRRLEVERGRLQVASDLDRVVVGEPVGRALVRKVRRRREQRREGRLGLGELGLDLLELGGHPGDLVDQPLLLVAVGASDRLRRLVLLGAQLVDARGERTPALVGREQLVDGAGEVAPGERRAEPLGVVPDRLDVEHVGLRHLHLIVAGLGLGPCAAAPAAAPEPALDRRP